MKPFQYDLDFAVRELVYKHPEQLLGLSPVRDPNPDALVNDAQKLIATIDATPFVTKCEGESCTNSVTCCVLHEDSGRGPNWFCDACSARPELVSRQKIFCIRTYKELLAYVQQYCPKKPWYEFSSLFCAIVRSKGLPELDMKRRAVIPNTILHPPH